MIVTCKNQYSLNLRIVPIMMLGKPIRRRLSKTFPFFLKKIKPFAQAIRNKQYRNHEQTQPLQHSPTANTLSLAEMAEGA
jgi:hypothetical protein